MDQLRVKPSIVHSWDVEEVWLSGINNVEWDAVIQNVSSAMCETGWLQVELPSQFMENWLYDKSTLYSFAKHYETDESLPEEYFDKLKGAKTYQAGLAMTRQLYFSVWAW